MVSARRTRTPTLPARGRTKPVATAQTSDEDRALFRQAVADAKPIAPDDRIVPQTPAPPPIPRQRIRDEQAALAASLSDEIDVDSLLETDELLSFRRPGIGPDVVRRLRRGHWVIQAELDLHGMRREEARESLATFVHEAQQNGLRCVRIIHGKGLSSPGREPVLKHKARAWLVQKNEVLAFCQAKPSDGGAGALVVLLSAAPVPGNRRG